jgi:hypothetical protein
MQYQRSANDSVCWCHRHESCPTSGGLYFYDAWNTLGKYDLSVIVPNVTLQGIVVDCLPSLMTYKSSLECFYNQSCLDLLFAVYSRAINISILNGSSSSRFLRTTILQKIIEELFLEEITNHTLFRAYYEQCHPISCSYTYSHRFDWIFVVTTFVALIGGLTTALRFITPCLVSAFLFMKRKLFDNTTRPANERKTMTTDDAGLP